MTTITCKDEKLALNLNPYQIFVFVNEKTKPYLNQIKENHIGRYSIELIPFDAEKDSQAVVGEDVDPLLYYNITHSDLFARVMPFNKRDFKYASEILFQGKDYSGNQFYNMVNNFALSLSAKESERYVNTLRRYFQYGNEEFYDFLMEVYDGNEDKIMEMSQYFTVIFSSGTFVYAEELLKEFMNEQSTDRLEQLLSLIKDTLGYASEKDSKLLLCNYLQYKYTPDSGGFSNLTQVAKTKNELLKPDFSLVIEYNKKEGVMDKDGDYSIILKKDDGSQIGLEFGHRGDKMLYLLTLLCQKTRGGLPTAYFRNEQAKRVLTAIYDRVYRSGGDEWVDKCSNNTHRISTYRSHAKEMIEKDERLEPYMAYWCNLENQTIYFGEWRSNPLEIRKIRLPEDRIEIHDSQEDSESLYVILDNLPQFEDLYGFNKINHPELFEIHKNLVCGVDQREDNAIRE